MRSLSSGQQAPGGGWTVRVDLDSGDGVATRENRAGHWESSFTLSRDELAGLNELGAQVTISDAGAGAHDPTAIEVWFVVLETDEAHIRASGDEEPWPRGHMRAIFTWARKKLDEALAVG